VTQSSRSTYSDAARRNLAQDEAPDNDRGTAYVWGMQLTRNRIIGAAMQMIERDGADAISMRRLATELGCGVISLYSQVPSKAALLDGVADAVMSGIEVPLMPDAGWQEQIRAQALAFRQIACAHPRCMMIIVSRPATSIAQLRPVEHALATLREAGVAPGLAGPDPAAQEEAGRRPRLKATEFPQVTSLAAELSHKDPDAEFDFGLDLLVHAAAALLPTGVR
jgi:AcrR family transcriptional regulator